MLALAFLLLAEVPGMAQVAESYTCSTCTIDSGDSGVTGRDLTTFTVDSGSNLCLIAILHLRTAVTAPAITWNGVAMTEIGSGIHGTNAGVRMFRLVNPATGNHTLAASWTTSSVATLGAVAFSGADQTTCVEAGDTVTATSNSAGPSTGAVTSTTDGATVGAETSAGNDISSGTQTEVYQDENQSFQSAGATYAIGGTSNTHSWTLSGGNQWAAMGVHVKAAAAAGGGCILGGGFFGGGC